MANANPFRFATEYRDEETDLLYYRYRYHAASTGRCNERARRTRVRRRFGSGTAI